MSVPVRAVVLSLVVAVNLVMLARPHDAAADCGDRIVLSATADGDAVAASGGAYVGSLAAHETFSVQVSADVPDGTQLVVFANGLAAGTVTVVGGLASLDLSNATGALPAGVDPVCQIGPISVTDADQTTTLLVNADFN